MTQLPEVEVIRKDLERDIVGKRFKDVTVKSAGVVARHRNRPEFCKALMGRRIGAVGRRGTALVLQLDDDAALVVRLGPQGSVSRETATAGPGRHTQVVASFTTGGAIHVVDPAGEAELYVLEGDALAALDGLAPSGIDPLAETFTWPAFSRRLVARNAPLKLVLVDDDFVVGLGELYSDEILWAAGLSGERSSAGLSSQEVRRLYRAVLEVLFEAVKQGGTETASEVTDNLEESAGFVKVYGREGEPCARCRQPIRRGSIDGRLSFYCANCQT